MSVLPKEIDESLYSRQLYVLGKEAMLKMQKANVLIVGLKGLGIEIAKNVALAGVKSLDIFDPFAAELSDLSSQFFLNPKEDLDSPRDVASQKKLVELNNYVPIKTVSFPENKITNGLDSLLNYQVVVLTSDLLTLEEKLIINDYCHKNDVCFISTETNGLFANVFVDFGDNFQVIDTNGEELKSGMISDIENNGTITTLNGTRHNLDDGSFVKFSEVEGIDYLNDGSIFKVNVLGPFAFKIDSTIKNGFKYSKGGIFSEVKVPVKMSFKSLRENLEDPEYFFSDFAKFDRPQQLHLGFIALDLYKKKFGDYPKPMSTNDAEKLIELVEQVNKQYPSILQGASLNKDLLKELAYQAKGDIPAVQAFIGGMVAQEVLKACSSKFTPLKQIMYFDSLESLPDNEIYVRSEETCKPINTRYDNQIAVFGLSFQQALANSKVFLVGSGAIGCEMLKNWSLTGLGSGPKGKIIITDNDSIEKSNLNRQFLFRSHDVGHNKSEVAAKAVIQMNPDLAGKIETSIQKVGPETEDIFDDEFWKGLDFVTNALDNIDARTYVDRRCVFFKKPLLESGTLGTKGNTQVVIPNLTESYSSSRDPPEKAIPLCTLRSFPNKIDHTIAWAKSLFQGYFVETPENVNLYLQQDNFVDQLLKQAGDAVGIVESIIKYVEEKPDTFEDCIKWGRLQFEKCFADDISQLLYNFPKNAKNSKGEPFWVGGKRVPKPLVFDINNGNHLDFVVGAANLRAFVYGLEGDSPATAPNKEFYATIIESIEIPEFKPQTGVKIAATEEEAEQLKKDSDEGSTEDTLTTLINKLPSKETLAGLKVNPVDFEKDDDTNHHIEFINAASNDRALNYGIETADKSKTKFIAGRIIPAIATTTALVAGLVNLELYKVLDGKNDIEKYKNGFVNLALPFLGFSEPIASPKGSYNDTQYDKIWDRFELPGTMTLQELIDYFEKLELEVTMISQGVSLLYASFWGAKKLKERLSLSIPGIVELVNKKPIESHVKNLVLEVCVDDKDGEEAEIPFCTVVL
ncbi:hypothetical protein QEN19_001455 [Hanseniaspora menglaensis]